MKNSIEKLEEKVALLSEQATTLSQQALALTEQVKEVTDFLVDAKENATPIYIDAGSVKAVAKAIHDYMDGELDEMDNHDIDNPSSDNYTLEFDSYDNTIGVERVTVDLAEECKYNVSIDEAQFEQIINDTLSELMSAREKSDEEEDVSARVEDDKDSMEDGSRLEKE